MAELNHDNQEVKKKPSSKLPDEFYNPIKVDRIIKFDRDEIYSSSQTL